MENENQNDPLNPTSGDDAVYWGKYRAIVLDNEDPLGLARLKVQVPALPITELPNWALPATPYAGPQEGFYFMPPLKANVWIEFEGGDPNFPIWSGCFWTEKADVPVKDGEPRPIVKVLQTAEYTLTIDDTTEGTAGDLILTCKAPAVKTEAKVTINQEGIKIENLPAVITIKPEEGITIDYPDAKITMTKEMLKTELSSTTNTMTSDNIEIKTTTKDITAETTNNGDYHLKGNQDTSGNTDITGNLSVTGTTSLTGAVSCKSTLAVG